MAEVITNLSEGSIELPQVTAPGTTTDKLYNVGGALTFAGGTITANGIANVIEDTSPQLGGELDMNGNDISMPAGSSINGNPDVTLNGEDTGTAFGGGILGFAGDGTTSGGNIDLRAGNAPSIGGSVNLTVGEGTTGSTVGVVRVRALAGDFAAPLEFREKADGGTGQWIRLKAPDITAAQRTWTLPDDNPSTVSGQFITTDSSGILSFAAALSNVVEDTTPQLGGNLDVNGNDIISADFGAGTGAGGAIDILAGDGGTTSGNGGLIAITSGAGTTAGLGGALTLTSGSGAGSTFPGGTLALQGGASGGGAGPSQGGPINITGGQSISTNGQGGVISITGGTSAGSTSGPSVTLQGGTGGATGNGGNASVAGGNPGATGPGNGGSVLIDGANAEGTGTGGSVQINGGDGDTTGSGGIILIKGGTHGASGGGGGAVSVTGGTGGATGGQANLTGGTGNSTNAAGGAAVVLGGVAQGSSNGGDARLTGGDADQSGGTGDGGQAEILGGDGGATSGDGGDVTIAAGTGDTDGDILLNSNVFLSTSARFTERADHALTPTATFGELWVRSDTPNVLVFTDDAGTDTVLGAGGGGGDVSKVGTPVDNQIGVWTGDGTLEGTANLTYNNSTGEFFWKANGLASNLSLNGDIGANTTIATTGEMKFRGAGSVTDDFAIGSQINLRKTFNMIAAEAKFAAGTTSYPSLNIAEGVAPTVPVDGDVWVTAAGAFNARLNGSTVDLAGGGGGVTNPMTANLDVGAFDIVSAAGVAATNPGSPIDIISGIGNTTGAGGTISITGGVGGATGGGGEIRISGGAGGASGPNGGYAYFQGGNATYAGSYGGYLYLYGGNGEYRGGGVEIKSGAATQATTLSYSGYLRLRTSDGVGLLGQVGELSIQGGASAVSSNEVGGPVNIIAGRGHGTATGGELLLQGGPGGAGAATNDGGVVTIRGGFGGATSGTGGNVNIYSGAAGAGANADGADITLVGAAGEGTNKAGGNISITPGAATGSGEQGAIVIAQTTAPTTKTDKLYNVSGALTWNNIDLTAAAAAYTYTLQSGTTYTAVAGDFVVASNTGTVTITLPSGHSVNDTIIVKKTGSGGTVTVDGNASETIDGALTFVMSTQYQSVTLISDGTNWLIV